MRLFSIRVSAFETDDKSSIFLFSFVRRVSSTSKGIGHDSFCSHLFDLGLEIGQQTCKLEVAAESHPKAGAHRRKRASLLIPDRSVPSISFMCIPSLYRLSLARRLKADVLYGYDVNALTLKKEGGIFP
jgi:hypothetical protein